MAKLKILYK